MFIAVVGAGLAGLAAAIEAKSAGHDVMVLESSDGPGGRVRTDVVDGFRLDRGFQILLTAYPEAQRFFNYDDLNLQPFAPGALVRIGNRFHRIGDPLRQPSSLLDTAKAPVGSLFDKARILNFRRSVNAGTLDDVWQRPEMSARERLDKAGFSNKMVERFLGPLFTGITLDPDLSGSSRVLEFVFRMLAAGDAAVPAEGMGALGAQLADRLPSGAIRYSSPVRTVSNGAIELEGGERILADAVVVATDQNEADRLTGIGSRPWRSVTSVWLAIDGASPLDEPILALNGTGQGAINSVATMSAVSADYAPSTRSLIVASSPGATSFSPGASTPVSEGDTVEAMLRQLQDWYGPEVDSWETIRVDRIERAQPMMPLGHQRRTAIAPQPRVSVCGDHLTDPSINGALKSGRAALAALTSSS